VSRTAHRRRCGPKRDRVRQAHDARGNPLDYILHHSAVRRDTSGTTAGGHFVLWQADSH